MKSRYFLMLFALAIGGLLLPHQQAKAQTVVHGDTMYVDFEDVSHNLIVNSLRSAVLGDTNTDGTRANSNRVYLLYLNGIYRTADRIANASFPLKLIGQPYTMGGADYPAQIQLVNTRPDASTADTRVITGQNDVTLRNLFITGRTVTGVQTAYQPYQIDGSGHTYIIDNCIIEQSSFALIAFTGKNNKIYYTNNKFRNLIGQPSTQQWEGRGISIWADQDTVIVENNTFFNIGFTPFQLEGGSAKYVRFNHNTVVNNGRGITGGWFQSAYFTNNLFINCWWHGEGFSDLSGSGRDPRSVNSGLFSIGALPSIYGPEEGRRIVFGKNYAYLDPKFTTLYGDTIHPAYFVDPVTKLDRLAIYTDHMNVGHAGTTDTVWLTSLPTGFSDPLANVDWAKPKYTTTGATMIDSMWSNITLLRRGVTPATPYFYKPTVNASDETWPLPENFSYTDANLLTKGTDGLPIGDLNWFPTQKATFLASQATNVAAIEALGGVVDHYYADSLAEAEDGAMGGTASVLPVLGFPYYDGPGDILWTFTTTAAGKIDSIVINTNRNGNGDRGQNFFLDGNQFHNATTWGELHFYGGENGSDAKAWYTKPITVDSINATALATANAAAIALFTSLPAGSHTLHVTSSWSGQAFGEVDLYVAGTKYALTIPNAVCTKGTPHVLNSPWAPSKYKYVDLGTAGTVAWTIAAPKTGNYVLSISYQNGGSSAKSVDLKLGSTVLTSPSLTAKSDSSEQTVVSGKFALTAGNNTITMSGGGAKIDYVQLYQYVIGAVGKNGPPSEYALEQNYPNPFNPSTTINFSIGKVTNVKLRVYNILGQQVMTLVDTRMTPGAHSVVFDAGKLASGVYFYRLDAGNFVSVKKMLLLK